MFSINLINIACCVYIMRYTTEIHDSLLRLRSSRVRVVVKNSIWATRVFSAHMRVYRKLPY